jgi:hypothetical protein
VRTITRALLRAARTPRRSARDAMIMVLAAVLAVGTLALSPAKAYAAVPEVRSALHAGVDASGPFAVFGSTVLFGTSRSTNTGGTWTGDANLSASTWMMAVNGTFVGYATSGSTYTAVVYNASTGGQTTYQLPGITAAPASMGSSWALSGSGVAYSAYNFVSGGSPVALTPPSGPMSNPAAQLTPSQKVLWTGSNGTNQPAYAVASSPTATPTAWLALDGVKGAVATPEQLVYVRATTSYFEICSRSLSDLTGAESCSPKVSGSFDFVDAQFSSFALWTLVNVRMVSGSSSTYAAYIWNGSGATKIAVPAGSYMDMPSSAGADTYGDTPYALFRDWTSTLPTIQRVNADGGLTAGFPLPTTPAAAVGYLSVTPDRVVGADTRDAALQLQTWTRTVSAGGFGSETLLPVRASGLKASAARTAVSGPAGLSLYDRGTARGTFSDPRLSQLSGPYVMRQGWNASASSAQSEIVTVDNTPVGTFLGASGALFGSEYVSWKPDPTLSTSARVVMTDLTGRAAAQSITLEAGTAGCLAGRVWSNILFLTCGTASLRAYDLATGTRVGSLAAPSGQFVNLTDVGDGYAIVTFNNVDYNLWNVSQGSLTPLTDCTNDATSDGVGHVACSSSSQLIWRDFSSLSTSAPRLLGVMASSTADFSNGAAWSIDIDTTKPLAAGSLTIFRAGSATPIRTLATPASTDGSIRGISWNGLDDNGKSVQAGSYVYTLSARAADASAAALTAVDGKALTQGQVTITSGNPTGMTQGAFMSVVPSRLLDTRVTGPALGSNQTRSLKVTGVGGVPTTGVAAVVLNVTVTDTTTNGYLTVSPTDPNTPRPVVSNLNWTAGVTIPNAVTVKVGPGGSIDLFQSGGTGTAQVIVDVAGYYIAGTPTEAGAFTPLAPNRILDTRNTGGPIAGYHTRNLTIATGNPGGVPTNAGAVVLNVTVTNTTSNGYLTVYPAGTGAPNASNLNWTPGLTIPNLVTVKLGNTPGAVTIYQSGPGSADVIVDVAGYYIGGTAQLPGTFFPLSPNRVLDTRNSTAVGPGGDQSLKIMNDNPVPASKVSAVVINTTVTDTWAAGYLTVYPGLSPLPTASNLNWSGPGTTIPNLVTVQVGSDGTIKFHNGSGGTVQVIADTAGYYIGT